MLTEKNIENLLLFFEDKFNYFLKLRFDNNFNYTLEALVDSQEQAVFQILATRKRLELANYDKEYSCVIKAAVSVEKVQEFVEHFDMFQSTLHNKQISIVGMPQDLVIEMGSFGRSGDPQNCRGNDNRTRAYVTYTLSLNLHLVTSSFLTNNYKVYIGEEEHLLNGLIDITTPSRSAQFAPDMTQENWQPELNLMSIGMICILTYQPIQGCEADKLLQRLNDPFGSKEIKIKIETDGRKSHDYYYVCTQYSETGVAGGRISTRIEFHKL